MASRVRSVRSNYRISASYVRDFINPYPWMPSTDARVYLELLRRQIPFSYRYFNHVDPYIQQLLPGWAPEFTLKDFKLIILVKGTFFGNIPGVLMKDILAKVILEQAGWKVLTWFEFDIVSNINALFDKEPVLRSPPKRGGQYTNPFGIPDVMEQFRLLRLRQKRYIVTNALVTSRDPGRRRRNLRGGAFTSGRQYRDLSRERPRTRIARQR